MATKRGNHAFEIEETGLDDVRKAIGKLSDTKKLVREPVQKSLDVMAEAERAAIPRGPSGKAKGSVGTHIHNAPWGVYGNAGPRGSGRYRDGFVAALFLKTGTGFYLQNGGGAKAYAVESGPFQAGSRVMSGRRVRIHASRQAGLIYPVKASVMVFPSQKVVSARFGGGAAFTKRGAYKGRKFGNAGLAFARYTRGMPRQDWTASAATQRNAAKSAFTEALNHAVAEASRVRSGS